MGEYIPVLGEGNWCNETGTGARGVLMAVFWNGEYTQNNQQITYLVTWRALIRTYIWFPGFISHSAGLVKNIVRSQVK